MQNYFTKTSHFFFHLLDIFPFSKEDKFHVVLFVPSIPTTEMNAHCELCSTNQLFKAETDGKDFVWRLENRLF